MNRVLQMTLGVQAEVDVHSGRLDVGQYERLTKRVLEAYGDVRGIAKLLHAGNVALDAVEVDDDGRRAELVSDLLLQCLDAHACLVPNPRGWRDDSAFTPRWVAISTSP